MEATENPISTFYQSKLISDECDNKVSNIQEANKFLQTFKFLPITLSFGRIQNKQIAKQSEL